MIAPGVFGDPSLRPQEKQMVPPVDAADHAFADGGVFGRDAFSDVDQSAADRLAAIWAQFDMGAHIGDGVKLGLNARLINRVERGAVAIEGPSAVRGILRVERGGRLKVGPFVYIGDDVLVSAMNEISIGRATLLAHGVQVFDNNTHPIDARQREVQFRRMLGDKSVTAPLEIETAPVVIGSRCWIGMNSIVMKGVSIGDDTIVAAGSIVTRSLPAGVVAAGNPATPVRDLHASERQAV